MEVTINEKHIKPKKDNNIVTYKILKSKKITFFKKKIKYLKVFTII